MINKEQNPWTTLSSTEIYDNPWIKVREDKVLTPTQKNGIYGVVTFKNKAIGIVPIDKEGNITLVGQYRYPLKEYSWEIPEGGGPMHEEPLETAKRELLEETGLVAHQWKLLGKIHTSNSVCNEVGFLFLAQELEQKNPEPEETEILQIKKIPLKEAVQWILEMKITDSLSIAGILMAKEVLGDSLSMPK
jgi:8-oxo-dGTP pyrophosphatase MutT (NUDIX family)